MMTYSDSLKRSLAMLDVMFYITEGCLADEEAIYDDVELRDRKDKLSSDIEYFQKLIEGRL